MRYNNGFMDANSGYCGYSMSNRAVEAYESGEKPISQWSKYDLLCGIKAQGFNDPLLEKLRVSELKQLFLTRSSWHHTSKMFNRTDFYSVDVDGVTHSDLEDCISSRNSRPEVNWSICLIHYGEWRKVVVNHYGKKAWKLEDHERYAIVIDNVAYLRYGTKRMGGKHIYIERSFPSVPAGAEDEFEDILDMIPESKRKCIHLDYENSERN